jgi:hypothetical protein
MDDAVEEEKRHWFLFPLVGKKLIDRLLSAMKNR